MTRFARAKGSKASNERREEDATPWHVMRQQLAEQTSNRGQLDDVKSATFLKGEILKNADATKCSEEVWSDFNESKGTIDCKVQKCSEQKKLKKPVQTFKNSNQSELKNTSFHEVIETEILSTHKSKLSLKTDEPKNKKKVKSTKLVLEKKCISNDNERKMLKKTQNNKNPEIEISTTKYDKVDKNEENISKKDKQFSLNNNNNKIKKRKISGNVENPLKNKKLKKVVDHDIVGNDKNFNAPTVNIMSHEEAKSFENNDSKLPKKVDRRLKSKNSFKTNKQGDKQLDYVQYNNQSNVQTIIANGRHIKIVKYEAFWVKEEDAAELRKFKKKLKAQKVPNDKIKTVMKLERRKAEKALAREKTNVCYHCRKFGHMFSECPDINNSEMSKSGMCFKCGSLEHTHFQCRVTQTQDFRFAVCFVCKEQGHIARQCPLNEKGQYPKGGCCHLCGEITHLRKDCPQALQETPTSTYTVGKINNKTQVEDIGVENTVKRRNVVAQKKLVKF